MSDIGIREMLAYVTENKKTLEGYTTGTGGLINPVIYTSATHGTGRDTFEKSENVKVFRSETYSKSSFIKGMPKGIFGDAFGKEMKKKIMNFMRDYYSKDKTVRDVKDFFKECCTAMRVYRTGQMQTSGYDEKDNQQIVSQIFEIFSKENQRAACRANKEEGIEINKRYGGGFTGDASEGFAYYNSFYYYECESMREVFREMAGKMTEEWDIPSIDTAEVEKNTGYTLDGGLDFNSGWNYLYGNSLRTGKMMDVSKVPPKDFRMFFNVKAGITPFG